jgi:hypothetical protein
MEEWERPICGRLSTRLLSLYTLLSVCHFLHVARSQTADECLRYAQAVLTRTPVEVDESLIP